MNIELRRDLEQRLLEYVKDYHIPLTENQARLMVAHLDLVIDKNKVVNLTRITEPTEGLVLHCLDSLMPLAFISSQIGSQDVVLDVGTGVGFPGIPLAIATGAHAVLIDSVGKKVNAVNDFATVLGLDNVEALHVRAEELALKRPESFSYLFARAVAQSNVLVEYAAPLLKKNGLLVLEKANPTEDEIAAANRAAKICGMKFVSRETCELPNGLGHREILQYQKVTKSKIKLPRQNGMAKNQPLGI